MDIDISDLSDLAMWAYLVIFGVAGGDAVLPVLPGETLVILGGVLANRGDLSVVLVFLAGAVGAALGDNVSYQIGAVANRRGRLPEEMPGRFGNALGWAEAMLHSRGPSMLLIGRFIPGGRTALTFGAGYVGFPRARFTALTILAASVWSAYATTIGYIGGEVFHDTWWAGLAVGLGLSFLLTMLIEAVRKARGETISIKATRAQLRAERRAAVAEAAAATAATPAVVEAAEPTDP